MTEVTMWKVAYQFDGEEEADWGIFTGNTQADVRQAVKDELSRGRAMEILSIRRHHEPIG